MAAVKRYSTNFAISLSCNRFANLALRFVVLLVFVQYNRAGRLLLVRSTAATRSAWLHWSLESETVRQQGDPYGSSTCRDNTADITFIQSENIALSRAMANVIRNCYLPSSTHIFNISPALTLCLASIMKMLENNRPDLYAENDSPR